MKKTLVCLVVLLMCVACLEEKYEVTTLWSSAHDIRITKSQEKLKTVQSDDPVGGAIVGAMFAGAPGAVIGAAAGSSDGKSSRVEEEVLACGFSVRVDDHTLDFRTAEKSLSLHCSLLREGDSIKVTKVVRTYKYDGKINTNVSYGWYVGELNKGIYPELIR
jgi:uncharacterized protein YcfJ